MDGNKDDALKCLRIGKEALQLGDRVRALKFLAKARRLDPALPIDDLLSAAADGGSPDGDGPGNPREEPEGPTPASASSSSFTSTGGAAARTSSEGSSRAYTEEQITIVRQIKKEKDYYQILGLERSCTVEDVRKAYRKLSLKVHPDKNKAPGAEEAFKVVSKAFQCLSNEENKKRYDLVGSEEPAYNRVGARRHANGFNGFYDGDVDAEEIFRNFFFGGMAPAATPFGPFQFRAGGMGGPSFQQTQGGGNFNLRALIQILPIIILLLLNFLPSNDPVYSFSRSYPYEYKVVTARDVPYFVKSAKFEQEYPYQSSERASLEQHVERDYRAILVQNCRVELQRRQWGLSYQIPNCDALRKFEETAS